MFISRPRLSDLSYIPVGRQLPRTPPALDCVQTLDFSESCSEESHDPNNPVNVRTPPIRKGSTDGPESMVKGMKGYQLTAADLEFMQKLKEEKEVKSLQNEVATLENELRSQQRALELTLASKANAEAELEQFPSSEDLREWTLEVLEKNEPSFTALSDLDIRALLVLVTHGKLDKAFREKAQECLDLENLVEQRKKNEARDQEKLEKLIAAEQATVLGLMRTLAEMKSSLAEQQEINKSLKIRKPPEAKVQEKPLKSGAMAKEASSTDHTNQGKRTRNGRNMETDKPTKNTKGAIKRDPAAQTKTITPQEGEGTSKSTAANSRAKRQKKVEQPVTSKTLPPKGKKVQHKGKSEVTTGAGVKSGAPSRKKAPVCTPAEDQDLGLRRSKRIACRK